MTATAVSSGSSLSRGHRRCVVGDRPAVRQPRPAHDSPDRTWRRAAVAGTMLRVPPTPPQTEFAGWTTFTRSRHPSADRGAAPHGHIRGPRCVRLRRRGHRRVTDTGAVGPLARPTGSRSGAGPRAHRRDRRPGALRLSRTHQALHHARPNGRPAPRPAIGLGHQQHGRPGDPDDEGTRRLGWVRRGRTGHGCGERARRSARARAGRRLALPRRSRRRPDLTVQDAEPDDVHERHITDSRRHPYSKRQQRSTTVTTRAP